MSEGEKIIFTTLTSQVLDLAGNFSKTVFPEITAAAHAASSAFSDSATKPEQIATVLNEKGFANAETNIHTQLTAANSHTIKPVQGRDIS